MTRIFFTAVAFLLFAWGPISTEASKVTSHPMQIAAR